MAKEVNQSLIEVIDQQLSNLRAALLSSDEDSDEHFAHQQFEKELIEWSDRVKRGAEEELEGQGQAQPAKRVKKDPAVVKLQCSVCLDEFPKADVLWLKGCKCRYCDGCFEYMLQCALDTSEIARCCDHNVKSPKAFKDTHSELSAQYEKLFKELDADNPFYCTTPTCSTFLGNYKRLKRKVTCKGCGSESCAACRKPMIEHKGIHKLCPTDVDDSMMKAAVVKYNMGRCPNCFAVVDKNGGCNHIRCRCDTRFCYACGEKLKFGAPACACERKALERTTSARNEYRP